MQLSNKVAKSTNDLLQQLTITEPYFQLDNLKMTGLKGETLVTQLQLSHFANAVKSNLEPELLSCAQINRSLTQLAICALQSSNRSDQRHFFICESLKGKNYQINNPNTSQVNLEDFPLTAKAKGKLSGQTAAAKIDLYNNSGEKIYSLKVNFMVFDEQQFTQKYAGFRHNSQLEPNQQKVLPALTDIIYTPPSHTAALFGPIELSFCAGHINGYNPLPTDILISKSVELARQWLVIQHPNTHHRYDIRKYQLITTELAFSHDELSITCCQLRKKKSAKNEITLSVLIYVRAQEISEMEIVFV